MMSYNLKALLRGILLSLLSMSSYATSAEEIYELVEPTKLARYSDITYYVRLPQGRADENLGRASSGMETSVRGVMALVTWGAQPEDVGCMMTGD
ncbi:hypothetical protein QEH59_18005 [Coraliomargarita sp. SDUM461004]|uniref:Uncharacterized protein n=1 Tax=Thalassobacterium sedimentorum TaxID=3041258 RepID=A0ABU1ANG0_9BACT|nr:hypothetical protein [Coraliomargarita sp. SDUM461004]MDQ8196335.1 hypothetical protein [Coraliomargarita sp. SDUM461004]